MKHVTIEPIKKAVAYGRVPLLTREDLKKALDEAVVQVDKALPLLTKQMPGPNSFGQVYRPMDNTEWTHGFWTGCLWLAYEYTGEARFRQAAEIHVQSYLHRIQNNIQVDHHDMGFLYSPSCVAAYKLTGNEDGKKAALLAADKLASRFQEKGQFIQAWGTMGAADNYRLIIDCLLNLPLLYWASTETQKPYYKEIAVKHLMTTCATVFRDDGSAFHTFFFDSQTGKPLKGVTHQGFKDNSSWARGQAWGIYGILLNYIYTKDESLIPLFKGVAHYFINRCPEDEVAYWDLIFSAKDNQERDSSSSVIAVCGLMEALKHLPPSEHSVYQGVIHATMRELIANYSAYRNCPESNGLLLHGVYHWHGKLGVDECNSWGDYYYLEALMRLYTENTWKLYW